MAVSSYAQQSTLITVLVVDTKTGKPVPHRGIRVYRISPETHMPTVEPGLPLERITDVEGRVPFSTTRLDPTHTTSSNDTGAQVSRKRLTEFRDILITYAAAGIQCSTGLFSLETILTTGIVGDDRCNKKFDPTKFKSTPGEVIFFVGKYHWWEAGET
jgi:hypothetical protein